MHGEELSKKVEELQLTIDEGEQKVKSLRDGELSPMKRQLDAREKEVKSLEEHVEELKKQSADASAALSDHARDHSSKDEALAAKDDALANALAKEQSIMQEKRELSKSLNDKS